MFRWAKLSFAGAVPRGSGSLKRKITMVPSGLSLCRDSVVVVWAVRGDRGWGLMERQSIHKCCTESRVYASLPWVKIVWIARYLLLRSGTYVDWSKLFKGDIGVLKEISKVLLSVLGTILPLVSSNAVTSRNFYDIAVPRMTSISRSKQRLSFPYDDLGSSPCRDRFSRRAFDVSLGGFRGPWWWLCVIWNIDNFSFSTPMKGKYTIVKP